MLGFYLDVGNDPAQIPNNASYLTGVGVQNLDSKYNVDLCDDPGFPAPFIYTLTPGQWYSFSGSKPFWCRISPEPAPPVGYNVQVWVNPGGAANTGGNAAPSGALAVDVVQPNPLPIVPVAPPSVINTGPGSNPPPGQDWTYTLPSAGRIRVFQASLQLSTAIATRYPYYQLLLGGVSYRFLMSDMTAHGSSLWNFVGATGLGNPYSRYGDTVMNFSIPDIFLPSGSQIGSYTGNMDINDYWFNIVLCMDGA